MNYEQHNLENLILFWAQNDDQAPTQFWEQMSRTKSHLTFE